MVASSVRKTNSVYTQTLVFETEDQYYDRQFAAINELQDLTDDAIENYKGDI